MPIVMAMVAGVFLRFGVDLVTAFRDDLWIALSMTLAFTAALHHVQAVPPSSEVSSAEIRSQRRDLGCRVRGVIDPGPGASRNRAANQSNNRQCMEKALPAEGGESAELRIGTACAARVKRAGGAGGGTVRRPCPNRSMSREGQGASPGAARIRESGAQD